MELLNPRLTVQNTDQPFWLVQMEHTVSEHEHINMLLKVPRSNLPVAALQRQLLTQAIALLTTMRDNLPPGISAGP